MEFYCAASLLAAPRAYVQRNYNSLNITRHAGLPPLRRRTRPALRLRSHRANQRHRHRQFRTAVARTRRYGVATAALDPQGFFVRSRPRVARRRGLALAPDPRRSARRVHDAELRRRRRRAEDRPDDLAEAYEDTAARGPRWRERLAATLLRLAATPAHREQAGAKLTSEAGDPPT